MTLHMDVRMNQRGITAELVELALEYGEWDGDRCRLDQRGLKRLLAQIDKTRSTALRALDKGGLVVVEDSAQLITTYQVPKRRKGRR
jgi:hypothetical protein